MTTLADSPTCIDQDPDMPDIDGNSPADPATGEQAVLTRPVHGQVAGELLYLDPAKLERARNRPLKPMNPGAKDSIVEHGNLLPLVVIRTEDGGFAVWDGWHRVVILRDTAHMALCAVYPLDTSAEKLEIEAQRIVLQFNSGAHRYAQNDIDRADAVAQMLDLGLNASETRAALVGITSGEVRAVKKIARSEAASQALYESGLDLMQSAAAAEHFGDDPDAIAELVSAAAESSGRFDHVLQLMQDNRARLEAEERTAAAYAESESRFAEAGLTVLTDPLPEPLVALEDLLDADGNTPAPESLSPQHLAVILVRQALVVDSEERIDVDQIDERTSVFPDDEPDPGKYHVAEVEMLDEFAPIYYCTDPDAAGLTRTDPEHDQRDETADPEPTKQDEDEAVREARLAREAAAAERERKAAEEASAKRAEATVLNRHARAATTVRRKWIATHLFGGQKSVPAGGLELIGRVVANPALLTAYHARGLAYELGAKVPNSPSGKGIKVRDNHGALRALLHVVAAMEALLQPTKDHPDFYRRVSTLMGDYMQFLAARGYELAAIERVLTGELTRGQVMDGAGATVGTAANPADDEDGEGEEATESPDDGNAPEVPADESADANYGADELDEVQTAV